ncbi:hypothetical protein RJ639_013246 [Escallonia herrerae]|uniref:DUF1279 domain-containing protein n=1 Tax=Escallonia herrerae TaxID=1293975 RepID=A0AA88VJG2_9ASTE|nr:hypothetical protein RJ639_013246 [Escallonia herrerae]
MATTRFRELLKKYGKVAVGVHVSVSAASITGLYVAIKNNADVESIFEKFGVRGVSTAKEEQPTATAHELPLGNPEMADGSFREEVPQAKSARNRTAELAASSGGAFALALLCNKALLPIRIPITIALTPPIARFLAKRRIIKSGP